MTPKCYARRLGSHNPTLCDKSTARLFNFLGPKQTRAMRCKMSALGGKAGSATSREEPAVKVAGGKTEVKRIRKPFFFCLKDGLVLRLPYTATRVIFFSLITTNPPHSRKYT